MDSISESLGPTNTSVLKNPKLPNVYNNPMIFMIASHGSIKENKINKKICEEKVKSLYESIAENIIDTGQRPILIGYDGDGDYDLPFVTYLFVKMLDKLSKEEMYKPRLVGVICQFLEYQHTLKLFDSEVIEKLYKKHEVEGKDYNEIATRINNLNYHQIIYNSNKSNVFRPENSDKYKNIIKSKATVVEIEVGADMKGHKSILEESLDISKGTIADNVMSGLYGGYTFKDNVMIPIGSTAGWVKFMNKLTNKHDAFYCPIWMNEADKLAKNKIAYTTEIYFDKKQNQIIKLNPIKDLLDTQQGGARKKRTKKIKSKQPMKKKSKKNKGKRKC